LAVALGILIMSRPAAGQLGQIVHLFDPVAYTGSALFIVAACAWAALIPALRAARIDPIASLRQD
jgi:ABC-type antimicrobial peptide transport system permease subunit